ncbi:type VI toxin-antitoxin system SocB family DNA replication inhibitor toxin [Rhizobium sp. Rhizsp82]|uniref:type VI toxin-antitoxin system SocB family DNA replication inhibitor toxin n=1 Tax=Rhizobium sp. Rhizsp82 TaxID=3243057 RepID=UPI0039B5F4D0
MKIRRLAETDLARIAVLSEDEKWEVLRKHRFARPPHTYNPVRSAQPDILNRQSPLFPSQVRTPWDAIVETLRKSAKHDDEFRHNLSVAKALYEFAESEELFSRQRSMSNWAIGFGQSIRFWPDYISVVGGKPEICFHDYRLTKRLNNDGLRFAFSVMHERTRALDPDLAEVSLAIYQFKKLNDGSRIVQRRTDENVELFTFDELNEMITATYRVWEAVLLERAEENRRSASGGTNPMGF